MTRKLKVVHWSYGARTALAEAEVEYADRTSPAITVAFPVDDAEARRMHLPTPAVRCPSGPPPPGPSRPTWPSPCTRTWSTPWWHGPATGTTWWPCPCWSRSRRTWASSCTPRRPARASPSRASRPGTAGWTGNRRCCWPTTSPPTPAPGWCTPPRTTAWTTSTWPTTWACCSWWGRTGATLPAVQDPELEGRNIFDCNPLVVDRLRAYGALLHEEKLVHSYPHCWRTKTPIFFRATEQWFITMDDELPGRARPCGSWAWRAWTAPPGCPPRAATASTP